MRSRNRKRHVGRIGKQRRGFFERLERRHLLASVTSELAAGESIESDDAAEFCAIQPEARVRLQATDLSGNSVTHVGIGQQFHLQAFVRDTRNGIPKGVVMATIDVAYDGSRLSPAGGIEHGERFPNSHTGNASASGLLDEVGASLWNVNWTNKTNPSEEDLLFRVLLTANSAGSVEFVSGKSQSGGIMLRDEGLGVPHREIEYGRLTLAIGSETVAVGGGDGSDGVFCRQEAALFLMRETSSSTTSSFPMTRAILAAASTTRAVI